MLNALRDRRRPIRFRIDEPSSEAINEASRDYCRAGFAWMDVGASTADGAMLMDIAGLFGLGEPFVPPLYVQTNATTYSHGINTIVARASRKHLAFDTTEGQELHVDGTLQPLAYIRTSVLYCVQPARCGGVSTLFDACRAFSDLMAADPDAGMALLADDVLERRESLSGLGACTLGPAFAYQGGCLLSRYSRRAATDHWKVSDDKRDPVRRGLEHLDRLARLGSPFYREINLRAGECLIISNCRLAHGRRRYIDHPAWPRIMLRALFRSGLRPDNHAVKMRMRQNGSRGSGMQRLRPAGPL